MSGAKDSEKIIELIQQLDTAYKKGLMSPDEYRTLRHGLEIRFTPPKRAGKKRKFKLKYALIAAIIIIVIVSASSLLLMQTNMPSLGNKPSFEISNVKFEQATLSFDLKNIGTAEATNVEIILRSGEGDIPIRVIDSVKPEDSPLTINESISLGENQELSGVQFNIVVTCSEEVTYLYPFTL